MCCSTDACDKEVGSCRACGTGIPQNARGKPKTFCSKKCRDEWLRRERGCLSCGGPVPPLNVFCSPECRGRKRMDQEAARGRRLDAVRCPNCGVEIARRPVAPGRNREYCSRKCRDAWRRKQAVATPTGSCARCGAAVAKGKSYCSNDCRWPKAIANPVPCKKCGKKFVRSSHGIVCCSPQCAQALRGKKAKEYKCLCCNRTFKRKRYPSGNVSCGVKYCSRECAFRARKEKKPCATRPLEVEARCRRELMWWRRKRDRRIEAESLRRASATPVRMCSECNAAEAARGSKGSLCESCGESRARALKRKARKRRRQKHGGDNYRQRCRRFKAPYTPIKKSSIYDRDNWACQICGVELLRKYLRTSAGVDPRSPTLDHIIPLCLGPDGPGHVETNVQAACFDCNSRKGASLLDSFASAAANKLP